VTADAHCHLFTPGMMRRMAGMPGMLTELCLDVEGASQRLAPAALQSSAERHALDVCMLLPSATPDRVRSVNDHYLAVADAHDRLRTAGTLHPDMERPTDELHRLLDAGCTGIKLSTFSQRFDLESDTAQDLLQMLQRAGEILGRPPVLVLDTFTTADVHFAAPAAHITTPAKVHSLAQKYAGIAVVGAHMGGLAAPPADLLQKMRPLPNLFLDTSNAAHVLPPETFVALLQAHGPDHVLFGTDWPWFDHGEEIPKVEALLCKAGFDAAERSRVMGGNARTLHGSGA